MSRLIISVLLFLPTASLAETVSCFKDKARRQLVISYEISDNPSKRLAGDIVNRGVGYSSGQVAQYKATKHEHFVMVDDPDTASYPLFVVQAFGTRKIPYLGQLVTYENSKPKFREKIYCWIK